MGESVRLAINGGPPAVTAGPFSWPPEDAAVREALDAAWRDGDWGRYHGTRCTRLSNALAAMHAVEHAQLCSSGTIAVELALRAVGVQAGDGVLLAGYDFPGNFRAIEAIGALPVLVDIDPRTWSMDARLLGELAGDAEQHHVRAIVVSHLHGGLADMAGVCQIAARHGWRVIEDACQAPGATLAGRPVGAWGDIGVLSFGGSKLLTAGRGGALLTDDAAIAQRLRVLNGRGNEAYPLSELQAAAVLPQLEALPARHTARERAAQQLNQLLPGNAKGLQPVATRNDASHAYYKLAWSLLPHDNAKENTAGATQQWAAALEAEGVPVGLGFRGFTSRSERRCRRLGGLQACETAVEQTLLLHHPPLLAGGEVIGQIAWAIKKVTQEFLGD